MSVWGKFGGGGLGLAIGGPIGALIGALAGHYLLDRAGAPFGPPPPDLVLTTGLVALAAKMAKADGVVMRSEVDAFRSIVIVEESDRPKVEALFRLAQETTLGFEAYASQLARTFGDEPWLLDAIVEALFLIGKADGAVHEAEIAYIRTVASCFGRDEAWFEAVLARHAIGSDDPYGALGAEREWDAARLRRHYLGLVADLHPDRMMARGLPAEAIGIATRRLAAVNAAWDRIETSRRLAATG